MSVPAGAAKEDLRVEYKPIKPWNSTGMRIVKQFELHARATEHNDAAVELFSEPVTVTVSYTEADVRGLDTASLRLFYFDEQASQWVPLPTAVDTAQKTLTATTDHFSIFGAQANPAYALPGMIQGFQTDLHSGTATAVYPIEVPLGHGLRPQLNLVYNSGSVDAMHNKRDIGSWVGLGWELHLGRVFLNEEEGTYYLELNGTSYKLSPCTGTGYNYCTTPESHLKIYFSGTLNQYGIWEVWDRDGTYYKFGGSVGAIMYRGTQQSYGCSQWPFFRFDLAEVIDTHQNKIKIDYQQNIYDCSVRSLYPTDIWYAHSLYGMTDWKVNIHFNSSFNRPDNPQAYGSNPAPQVMDNKRLDSIEVKVLDGGTWNLARRYDFTYATTSSTYSSDYGGIYYAGQHTLTSVRQVGSDGVSNLPTTSFTYASGRSYFNDPGQPPSSGNPGNPAQIWLPRLTNMANGYGGSVSYVYDEKPTAPVDNIWTRRVVTSKTVDPDPATETEGVSITTIYAYSGDPEYYVTNGDYFNAEYRGFRQVTETLGDSSSTEHYFYTTGQFTPSHPVDGALVRNGDDLKGREYETVWKKSDGTEVQRAFNDWVYAGSEVRLDNNGIVVGTRKVWTRYEYDAYGNVIREKFEGDTSASEDDVLTRRFFYPNTTAWVINREAERIVYEGLAEVASQERARSRFYYDGALDHTTPPTVGNLTKTEAYTDATNFVTTTYNYDGHGNIWKETNPRGHSTHYYYEGLLGAYLTSVQYPIGMTGSFVTRQTWDYVLGVRTSETDLNGVETRYEYDVFGRPLRVIRAGDSPTNPTERYSYLSWGTAGQQRVKIETKVGVSDYLWAEEYFDGLGRIVQVRQLEDGGQRLIASTSAFDNRGLLANSYIPWRVSDATSAVFQSPAGKPSGTFTYDVLGRTLTETSPDGSLTTHTWTVANSPRLVWTHGVTDPLGHQKRYTSDTRGNLARVEELDGSLALYNQATYRYDALNRLVRYTTNRVEDASFQEATTPLGAWTAFGPDTNTTRSTAEATFGDASLRIHLEPGDNSGNYGRYQDIPWRPGDVASVGIWRKRTASNGLGDLYLDVAFLDASQNVLEAHQVGSGTGVDADWVAMSIVGKVAPVGTSYLRVFPEVRKDGTASGTVYVDGVVVVKDTSIVDYSGAATTMTYDWLGRKTAMSDPDMGDWSYSYDGNGNLEYQTDARGVTLKFVYDAINRLTEKRQCTIADCSTSDPLAGYGYDDLSGGNVGRGRRTSDSVSGGPSTSYVYDARGRLVQEIKTIEGTPYATSYMHDQADRLTRVMLPNGEVMTQAYTSGSGLPSTLSSSTDGMLVTASTYNELGLPTQLDLGNGVSTNWEYWGIEHQGTPTDEQYGRLYRINTSRTDPTNLQHQDLTHRWDAAGNLTLREDLIAGEAEAFGYDFLDRLTTNAYGPSGLLSFWSFDAETVAGTDVGDLVGPNDGTLANGSALGAGRYGAGVSLDGVDDYVRVPHGASLMFPTGSSITLAAWVKPDAINGDRTVLIKGHDTNGITNYGLATPDGRLRFMFWSGDGTNWHSWLSTDAVVAIDAWTHVAVTFTFGTGTSLQAYVNGAPVSGSWVAGDGNSVPVQTTEDLLVGLITPSAPVQQFDGQIDEVRIYSRALSSLEVADLYERSPLAYAYDSQGNITSKNGASYTYGSSQPHGVTHADDPDLAAHWTMDAASLDGTTLGDEIGGNQGIVLGAVTAAGRYSEALAFDGMDDYVDAGDDVSLRPALITVAGWATFAALNAGGSEMVLVDRFDHLVQGAGYMLKLRSDNRFQFSGRTTSDSQDVVGTTTVAVDTWYHVVGTWDGADLRIYVNGALEGTQAMTGGSLSYGSTRPVELGRYRINNDSYLHGALDEVRLYSRALTGAEVAVLYGASPRVYRYDANGNMTLRQGNETLTYDAENRLTQWTDSTNTATFVYDADGNRVAKTAAGTTRHYVNQWYEVDVTASEATVSYWHGSQMVAVKKGSTLTYVHQEHLGSSSVVTNTNGAQVSAMSYLPYGETRSASGTLPTERQFTGQRLDGLSGLHFYNARYYDAGLGRFASPDTIVPGMANPQAWNRYSYALNNPLRFTDPTGHYVTQEETRRYQSIQRALEGSAYSGCDDGDCGFAADMSFVRWYEAALAAEEAQQLVALASREASTGTYGVGIQIQIAGGGLAVQFEVQFFTVDSQGDVAPLVITALGGGSTGFDGSVSGVVEVTQAKSVRELSGASWETGASATFPTAGIASAPITLGASAVGGTGYGGLEINGGFGGKVVIPAEVHAVTGRTWVPWVIDQPFAGLWRRVNDWRGH